jgi:hypothetical protein
MKYDAGYFVCKYLRSPVVIQRRPVPLIPNLQELKPTWPAEFHGPRPVNMDLAADGIPCNTYFFYPRDDQVMALQVSKGSRTIRITLTSFLDIRMLLLETQKVLQS